MASKLCRRSLFDAMEEKPMYETCYRCHKDPVAIRTETVKLCAQCYANDIFTAQPEARSAYHAQPRCKICGKPYLDLSDFAYSYANGSLSTRVNVAITCRKCGDMSRCTCNVPDACHKQCVERMAR